MRFASGTAQMPGCFAQANSSPDCEAFCGTHSSAHRQTDAGTHGKANACAHAQADRGPHAGSQCEAQCSAFTLGGSQCQTKPGAFCLCFADARAIAASGRSVWSRPEQQTQHRSHSGTAHRQAYCCAYRQTDGAANAQAHRGADGQADACAHGKTDRATNSQANGSAHSKTDGATDCTAYGQTVSGAHACRFGQTDESGTTGTAIQCAASESQAFGQCHPARYAGACAHAHRCAFDHADTEADSQTFGQAHTGPQSDS